MSGKRLSRVIAGMILLAWIFPGQAAEALKATLQVHTAERSPFPIPRFVTGKFTEHLFNNVTHGIEAQVLRNPTFAEVPFWTGSASPDGVANFHWEREKIGDEIRRRARQAGMPNATDLVEGYNESLACWWYWVGPTREVRFSPDTAPYGKRAQRVEVEFGGQGIGQQVYLPLHRVRRFQFELYLYSPDINSLTVALQSELSSDVPGASVKVALTTNWSKVTGTLDIRRQSPAETPYAFQIMADDAGQLVIGHAFLWPADHINGADPDVVRLYREARVPIHRWPGGNFVSAYHWEDGIGRVEQRPTRPNYAWGNAEPNTFGTHEFIMFSRAIGSEPMICVNAGDGTPAEAARWVEYCNGSIDTPMGRLRASHGHPEPYRVRHWEVGNELWGKWQVRWTTPTGYADRFAKFRRAMLAADTNIQLYACGAPVHWGKAWNDTLINRCSNILTHTTDHPLLGGDVSRDTDPMDVFRDFMAIPEMLETRWSGLKQQMSSAGILQPRLGITELQMFAHLGLTPTNAPVRLFGTNLVNPGTLAEGLYDVLFYHVAARLAPFINMITHSATVNHGGGLRKERERVYANPCYYAQAAFADFAEARPVAFELDAPTEPTPRVLQELRNYNQLENIKIIDALPAIDRKGDLLISLVHRGTTGPVELVVELDDYPGVGPAQVRTLTAPFPWAANSLANPTAISPVDTSVELEEGKLRLQIPPWSVLRIRLSSE